MTATASSEALTESGVQASSARRREPRRVNSRAWQAIAVAVGVGLLAVTALDIVGVTTALGEPPFELAHDSLTGGPRTVTRITHPDAIAGAVHPGDRVRLVDRSILNRLAFSRSRIGDRFAFTGVRPDGSPVSFVATMRRAPPAELTAWIYQLLRLVLILAGIFVAVRRPADRVARMLAMFFFSIAALIELNGPLTPVWLGALMLLGVTPFAEVFAAFAAMEIAVTFPQPSARGVRAVLHRVNPWVLGVLLVIQYAGVASAIVPSRPLFPWLQPIGGVLSLAYFGAIAIAFRIAYRGASGGDKQRVAWVWSSVAIGFCGPLLTLALILANVPLAPWMQYLGLTLIAIPFGLGYAIVRHRVIDVGFVLNRALVFGTVSGLVLLAFGALEWLLGNVLVRISHITSAALELGLALVLGFSLRGIHARVDRFIDDLFFRARHEADRALRAFARDVVYINDPCIAIERAHDELVHRTAAADAGVYIVDAVAARRIDREAPPVGVDDAALVRLRATRAPLALADVSTALPGEWAFPMTVRDAVTGVVTVAAKTTGETYAPDEIATVETVATALGRALDALHTAAVKSDLARVLSGGAPLETLRGSADAAAWIRAMRTAPSGRSQPVGSLSGLIE